MWQSFARHACDIHERVSGVCVCVQSIIAARVKRSKVWAHITKLSDTSVRCNMCSSVIVNKGGNTSNIMKHLLTKHNIYFKQCAVFTLSPVSSSNCNSQDTVTSNVESAVEFHSRDAALIRNHKSTLFACALV